MFRTVLLPIIRSLNTVFTATGICYTIYVDCLLASSGWYFCWLVLYQYIMMHGPRNIKIKSIFSLFHNFLTGTWDKTTFCLLDNLGCIHTCKMALFVAHCFAL